jgi:phage anti-repressor protein
MSSDLIPVVPALIGDAPVNTVDARVLHAFLEVQSDFRNWIKNRIDRYGFIENQDFATVGKNLPGGGKQNDYHVTLDMAKELAMVERNAKGKEARQYFIECERRLKEQRNALPNFANPAEAARAFALEYERAEGERLAKEAAQRQIEAMRPAQAFHDQITGSDELWDQLFLFSVLKNKTGQEFNQRTWLDFLRRHGIAKKANPHAGIGPNRFQPRQAYIGSWFVGEPTGFGGMEWKIRPMAVAGIVRLIELDRNQSPMGND